MPRPPRNIVPGSIYHVCNRGNDARVIFGQDADYADFMTLLRRGRERADVDILGFALMPTHFHCIAQPKSELALSAYMHWVTGCYARDLRARTQTSGLGHVFQRRYWCCKIRDERYFFNALRYVEANPIRKKLVERAEKWPWSSLSNRAGDSPIVSALPMAIPAEWVDLVNRAQDEQTLAELRRDLSPPRQPKT
jgi:putative transposase